MATNSKTSQNMTELECPTCGKSVAFDLKAIPPEFPFCSMRCKAADLGVWLAPNPDSDEFEEDEFEGVSSQDLD